MITRDEAEARAESWVNGGAAPDDHVEVGIFEFDDGFVVWGAEPEPDDPTRPPATVGSARGVIDRQTGELTIWPPLPVPVIAEQYSRAHQADDRFAADVLDVLRAAGWQPGRDVSGDVVRWLAQARNLGDPPRLFPAARAALDEFGGLRIEAPGKFPFTIQPTDHEPDSELYEGLAEILDQDVFPIGVRHDDGPSELTIDTEGRVFASHWSGSYLVGTDLNKAITTLVHGAGNQLPRVLADGSFEQA